MSEEQVNAIYEVTKDHIKGFFKEHRWLSNFHETLVQIDGITYCSSEAAYMAEKTEGMEQRKVLAGIVNPGKAKRYGQTVTLRPNWDSLKIEAMHKVVRAKFEQNKALAALLNDTADKYLEETNWWHDTFWGVCNGVGANNLGKILMDVRRELRSISLIC